MSKLATAEAPTTADFDSLAEFFGQPQNWRRVLLSLLPLSQQAVSEIPPADKSRQPLRIDLIALFCMICHNTRGWGSD